jgi:hypothetical protein
MVMNGSSGFALLFKTRNFSCVEQLQQESSSSSRHVLHLHLDIRAMVRALHLHLDIRAIAKVNCRQVKGMHTRWTG